MKRLSDMIIVYLLAQAKAGAQALQLFDSWVGWLSRRDYIEYVCPYTTEIIRSVKASGVPVIHFATGAGGLNKTVKEAGADVVGLDWRDSAGRGLGRARKRRRRAGQPGPRRPSRAARTWCESRPATCCDARAAGPAISSTSDTASCRRLRWTTYST